MGRADRWESMYKPLTKAEILYSENVGGVLMLGSVLSMTCYLYELTCAHVGNSDIIAIKDRVTGHSPLTALYTSSTYYMRLMPTK